MNIMFTNKNDDLGINMVLIFVIVLFFVVDLYFECFMNDWISNVIHMLFLMNIDIMEWMYFCN